MVIYNDVNAESTDGSSLPLNSNSLVGNVVSSYKSLTKYLPFT